MTSATQKLQILESLNALDSAQANDVLAYIKNMLNTSKEARYKKFKHEAMNEIRQELSRQRILTKVTV